MFPLFHLLTPSEVFGLLDAMVNSIRESDNFLWVKSPKLLSENTHSVICTANIQKCPEAYNTQDKVSDQPIILVREMDESESRQMVLEKVKWTFFMHIYEKSMWNHAKKSMEGSKLSDSVFLQWEVTDWQELFAKIAENKGN